MRRRLGRHLAVALDEGGRTAQPSPSIDRRMWPIDPEDIPRRVLGTPETLALAMLPATTIRILAITPPMVGFAPLHGNSGWGVIGGATQVAHPRVYQLAKLPPQGREAKARARFLVAQLRRGPTGAKALRLGPAQGIMARNHRPSNVVHCLPTWVGNFHPPGPHRTAAAALACKCHRRMHKSDRRRTCHSPRDGRRGAAPSVNVDTQHFEGVFGATRLVFCTYGICLHRLRSCLYGVSL